MLSIMLNICLLYVVVCVVIWVVWCAVCDFMCSVMYCDVYMYETCHMCYKYNVLCLMVCLV